MRVVHRQVGHGDGLVDAGRKRAAADVAELAAVRVDERRALAHRHALQAAQAHTLARCVAAQVRLDDRRARVAASACATWAAHFLDRPGQAGFDGRGARVEVVPVQAQPRFKPQGVARTQARRQHFRLRQQGLGQRDGLRVGHRDLETVFAGVARARDEAARAGELENAASHEAQLRHRRVQPRDCRHRLRPLQRQQRAIGHRHHLAAVADVRGQVQLVGVLARRVDDEENVAETSAWRRPHDHQIVEHAARGIGEEGVALLAHGQADDVDRHQAFERRCTALAHQADLAHVRDVEQRRSSAAMLVLGAQPGGVLHRHVVAGEGHHARTVAQMQGVQGGALQDGFTHGGSFEGNVRRASVHRPALPSLSALPERFSTAQVTCTRQPLPLRWTEALTPAVSLQ